MFEKEPIQYASEEDRSEGRTHIESQPASEEDARKTTMTRVAKACLPCSTKKRRCDGGKPECKVCVVLGTPCTYESKGLKRGPPKGFRSGPKESARARLLRNLETTIRDLSLQMGSAQAGGEILRISRDRGVALGVDSESSTPAKRVKRSLSEPSVKDEGEEPDQEEDFLGINEQGSIRHFGSSSGIQLLHSQQPPTISRATSLRDSSQRNRLAAPNGNASTYPLPTVPNRLYGVGSNTSHSNSPIHSPVQQAPLPGSIKRQAPVSLEMNRRLFYSYWEGFHSIWPVLYKPAFDELSVDQLPMLLDEALLNAVYAIAVCVASPSLDAEAEAELGDAPAGEVFFHRAETSLFGGNGTPTPSLSSIQVCFFLALYCQGSGQLSKAWIFSSLANSMSFDLGLHRHLHHFNNNPIEKESRIRLIHCVYILSTILSAEMGRPPMLRTKDIDVPFLSEGEKDEFETDPLGNQLYSASCLNASLRLFSIVETVLSQVHSFRRKAALRRVGSDSTRAVVKEIGQRLDTWRKTLPGPLKLLGDRSKDGPRLLPNFIAVHLWYHTAVLLLNRPFIPHEEGSSLQEVLNDPCHIKCTKASNELFELLLLLSNSNNVDRLSTDLAYCIFTAAVMFLFNARLGQSAITVDEGATLNHNSVKVLELSGKAKMHFQMCKEWLRGLSARWPAASAHKQLLDGFSSVGEDVLRGTGEIDTMSRTQNDDQKLAWTQQAGPNRTWDVSSEREMKAPHEQQVVGTAAIDPSLEYNTPRFTNAGSDTSYRDELQLIEHGYRVDANQYMHGNRNLQTPEQQQQSYVLAPNIFDMESVYWNETASRNPATALDTTKGGLGNILQQPRPPSSAGIGYQSAMTLPPFSQAMMSGPTTSAPAPEMNLSSQDHNGLQMLAQATTAGFQTSPFSFHQEPSRPEFQDLLMSLQLPPAFLQ